MTQRAINDDLAVFDALSRASVEELCKALSERAEDVNALCDALGIDRGLSGASDDELFAELSERLPDYDTEDILAKVKVDIKDVLDLASADQLCAALNEEDVESDYLIDKLGIELDGALDGESLCDAIAEGRLRDALDILHDAGLGNGLHPSTQLHLVELRRTA